MSRRRGTTSSSRIRITVSEMCSVLRVDEEEEEIPCRYFEVAKKEREPSLYSLSQLQKQKSRSTKVGRKAAARRKSLSLCCSQRHMLMSLINGMSSYFMLKSERNVLIAGVWNLKRKTK